MASADRRRAAQGRRDGRPAPGSRQPITPVLGRGGGRHRAGLPRLLRLGQTRAQAGPAGHSPPRDRRARRHHRPQRDNGPGAAGQAGRGGGVPDPAQGQDQERPGTARHRRLQQRPRPVRLPPRPDRPPRRGQGRARPGPHPARGRPPGRALGHPHVRMAGAGEPVPGGDRRKAGSRRGPQPRQRRRLGTHDTPCVNLVQRLVLPELRRGLRPRRAGRGRRAYG